MKVSQVFKIIIFFALFLLISIPVTMIFVPKWFTGNTPMSKTTFGFYAQEKDSIDVLYVGSSQILRGISPLTIWEEQGIAGYTRATTVQPAQVALYYVKEAEKRQDLKLVVIDFSALYSAYDPDEQEPYLRYAFDDMPLDALKIKTVADVLQTSEEQTVVSYVYPLLRYHSRWTDLTQNDFTWLFDTDFDDPAKGAVLLSDVAPQERDVSLMTPSTEVAAYNENSYAQYAALLDYCNSQGIQVLSIRMPRMDWTDAKHNADVKFAETYNIDYVDTNEQAIFDEIGLDTATDFVDYDHLNADGAVKLSVWLGTYLNANYTLPDTRDDASYQSWQDDYEAFLENGSDAQ